MTIGKAVKIRILTLLNERNLSLYRLAKNSALSYNTLTTIVYEKAKGVNMKTIFALCYGFGITLAEFFDDPIFDYNTNIIEY